MTTSSNFQLGTAHVTRLLELEGPLFQPQELLPTLPAGAVQEHLEWLRPHFVIPDGSRLFMAMQSWLIRHEGRVILIDSCIGENKERPYHPAWMNRQSPWLAQLRACGVQPEDVNLVMCTHLHPDHVGWNTKLADGRWVPTFPNARYLFSQKEYQFWHDKRHELVRVDDGAFADSVLPVVEAGLSDFVDDGYELASNMVVEATPGHSPGHLCVRLASQGAVGLFSGDLMHHPIQIAVPECNSRFCVDPQQSVKTRRQVLDRYADSGALVFSGHFPTPSVGRIVGGRSSLRYVAGNP